MATNVYKTNNPALFIVGVGEDDAQATAHAAAGLQGRSGAEGEPARLVSFQGVPHSVIIELNVINNQAIKNLTKDDVILANLQETFRGRTKVSLVNTTDTDGILVKEFYFDEVKALDLKFAPEVALDYEKNGMTTKHYQQLVEALETEYEKLITNEPQS